MMDAMYAHRRLEPMSSMQSKALDMEDSGAVNTVHA